MATKLYHKGNPKFRSNILTEGLKPKVGESYYLHWEGIKDKKDLKPLIFLYDKDTYGEYDSTYDDDIWEIDTRQLDSSYLGKDEGLDVEGVYTYSKPIPKSAIKLIYKGSGNPKEFSRIPIMRYGTKQFANAMKTIRQYSKKEADKFDEDLSKLINEYDESLTNKELCDVLQSYIDFYAEGVR